MSGIVTVSGPRAESFLYAGWAFRMLLASIAESLTEPEDLDELRSAQAHQHLVVGPESMRVATLLLACTKRLTKTLSTSSDSRDLKLAENLPELAMSLEQFLADPGAEHRAIPPPGTTRDPPTGVVVLPDEDGFALPGWAFRRILKRTIDHLTWPLTPETVANGWWDGCLNLEAHRGVAPKIAAAMRDAAAEIAASPRDLRERELVTDGLPELQRRLDAFLARSP